MRLDRVTNRSELSSKKRAIVLFRVDSCQQLSKLLMTLTSVQQVCASCRKENQSPNRQGARSETRSPKPEAALRHQEQEEECRMETHWEERKWLEKNPRFFCECQASDAPSRGTNLRTDRARAPEPEVRNQKPPCAIKTRRRGPHKNPLENRPRKFAFTN